MNAFIDSDGVLTSWGYASSNNDDALVVVPDDFVRTPGSVKTSDGGQTWVPVPAEHTPANPRSEIEVLRLRAYADPISGSDRYFAEAARVQAMGGTEEEVEAARAAGAARSAEIQVQYPWPT
ncbi:hypothetical protein [Pseudomonas sp. GL-RE-29]|jgi:hypothetical protein|uniref:hypothetical protein n=1 Tax=Pseudomonas sp. GL-RE-29 TaxID=2832375 RepID=UPI001CBF23E3|nr:hypothetical protein [Pseudomonas sp. GL-RE-29]